MSLRDIPKVELHLHLEGGAPPDFIKGLAAQKKLRLDGIFDADGGYVFRDFGHFLNIYDQACEVLTGPEEFYKLTRAVLSESAFHGVIYTEAVLRYRHGGIIWPPLHRRHRTRSATRGS